ncbi:MAG: class I SAM-dependent methyltransferase [Acidimicrobiales bacterium]
MTVTEPTATELNDERLGAFAEETFGAALATIELSMIYLGRRLGLYEALRGAVRTSSDLAREAAIDERYSREWLEQQAVAGVLSVRDSSPDPQARTFELPEEHAVVLLDEEHPAYSGALADIIGPLTLSIDLVAEAFRTGAGVPFAAYGLHDMQAGFTRPMFANSLVADWLPALPDVHARLEAGEPLRIADVGCGEGWAAIYVAEAYPNVTVAGFDLDDASVAQARSHISERGLDGRVSVELQDIAEAAPKDRYDLVMATEVIHDLADPVDVLTAMRHLAGEDGAVLIIDENASESFEAPGDEVQRLLYGFSVLHCLPAGRTHEHSAATGTVMRPSTLDGYARGAGFGTVEVLPIEHPVFRFYRLGA